MENVVQQIRIKYSITQEELAHILGVSYSSVNAWEGGKRVPQEQMLHMLTDILNESSFLIYRGGNAPQLVADAWNCTLSETGVLLKGVVSRKKQLIPALINALAEEST